MKNKKEYLAALTRLGRGLYGDKPSTLSQRINDAMTVGNFVESLLEEPLPTYVPVSWKVFDEIKSLVEPIAGDYLISSGEQSKRNLAIEVLDILNKH